MKVNIKLISEKTGVSPATVSNALNRKKGVNKETAAKVIQAAKELGYIKNDMIRKVRLVVFKKSGQIVEDASFFTLLLSGVEEECRNLGYELVMQNLDLRCSDFEEQLRIIVEDESSAIVLLGTELGEGDLHLFSEVKVPLITLDYWDSSMTFDGVVIDNRDSAQMAVEYLISKGHQSIGYLRGSMRIHAFRERHNGYLSALKRVGILADNKNIYTLGTTIDEAYHDMLNILSRKPKLPTAFFADNDVIAIGAIRALNDYGYRVPDKISMIGFDDIPLCEIVHPRLTTIGVPKQEMGQVAVRRIHEMIRNKGETKQKISVCTKLILRDTVRSLRIKESDKNNK